MAKASFKKVSLIALIAIIVFIIGALIVSFFVLRKEKEAILPPAETEIERQMRELNALRGNAAPLTEEQIKQQQEELDVLRSKKVLPKADVQKQSDELDALRNLQY